MFCPQQGRFEISSLIHSRKGVSIHTNLVSFFCFSLSRELAIQIAEQFEALGAGIGVKCAVVSLAF